MRKADAFRVTWSKLVSDTSPKCIDLEDEDAANALGKV